MRDASWKDTPTFDGKSSPLPAREGRLNRHAIKAMAWSKAIGEGEGIQPRMPIVSSGQLGVEPINLNLPKALRSLRSLRLPWRCDYEFVFMTLRTQGPYPLQGRG